MIKQLIENCNIDTLRKTTTQIHYFGLGFIQIKLDYLNRVHLYCPDLEPIIPFESVHNHRYSFVSHLVKGELTNQTFTVVPGNSHISKLESCKDPALNDTTEVHEEDGTECSVVMMTSTKMVAGSEYYIHHDLFHRVIMGNRGAITLVTRENPVKEKATVVTPVDQESVCPFSRRIPEKELWEIVEREFNGVD